MKTIATAGNTVVPALLALENLGFRVSVERGGVADLFRATRGDDTYLAEDPVAVLGLAKLIEMRGWNWQADDVEIDEIMRRYGLG
jgi:hypothetical protein